MATYAAVTTGKGSAAIATLQIVGPEARAILQDAFRPASAQPAPLQPGRVTLGSIVDDDRVIDQVTVGCESTESLAIHCHGNPLIVEVIAQLLGRSGAALCTPEQLLTQLALLERPCSTIAVEARIAQLHARTLEGTKLIANQPHSGLAGIANRWLEQVGTIKVDDIRSDATEILARSEIAKLIIHGCTVALIGPPNTGKSTLFNVLAGRDRAIVSHIEGTTRDWIETQHRIGPLDTTLVDTAGLDAILTAKDGNSIDDEAQTGSTQILDRADVVLFVLDNSRSAEQLNQSVLSALQKNRVLTVLNKSDLPPAFDQAVLPSSLAPPVHISARQGAGLDTLRQRVLAITHTAAFDLHAPVAFTDRQSNLLGRIAQTSTQTHATECIKRLLKEPLAV